MRRIARQAVELSDRHTAGLAGSIDGLDLGIQHAQRNRHVAGMGGDTGVAGTDHPERAAEPADRRTAGTGPAFIAGLVGVIEIGAAGTLEQVAAGRRLVAQLPRGTRDDGPGKHTVVLANPSVCRQRRIADKCADTQAALPCLLDPVQPKILNIDEVRRRLDLQLHQVEQIGAARDELGALVRGDGRSGRGRGLRALISESLHTRTSASWVSAIRMPATSAMASAIFE